nr:MAG TPA: hypothetical protein [Caudoviricetes sp.]
MENQYTIKKDREHYEIYKNGKFLASADTKTEAKEIIKEEEERGR